MRVKFDATDATGKVQKRSSMSHVYSHCVLIHFAAHPPSKFWPKGVAAARGCSEITVRAGDVHQGMGFKGLPRSTLSIAGEAGQKRRTGSTRKPAGGNSKSLCRGSTLYCNGCGL
jgi:hypothetical protein